MNLFIDEANPFTACFPSLDFTRIGRQSQNPY